MSINKDKLSLPQPCVISLNLEVCWYFLILWQKEMYEVAEEVQTGFAFSVLLTD